MLGCGPSVDIPIILVRLHYGGDYLLLARGMLLFVLQSALLCSPSTVNFFLNLFLTVYRVWCGVWCGVWGVCGVCFFSIAVNEELIIIVSPLYTMLILIFVSGITLLEDKSDKKWGGQPAYEEYKKSTPVLVPFMYCWT